MVGEEESNSHAEVKDSTTTTTTDSIINNQKQGQPSTIKDGGSRDIERKFDPNATREGNEPSGTDERDGRVSASSSSSSSLPYTTLANGGKREIPPLYDPDNNRPKQVSTTTATTSISESNTEEEAVDAAVEEGRVESSNAVESGGKRQIAPLYDPSNNRGDDTDTELQQPESEPVAATTALLDAISAEDKGTVTSSLDTVSFPSSKVDEEEEDEILASPSSSPLKEVNNNNINSKFDNHLFDSKNLRLNKTIP